MQTTPASAAASTVTAHTHTQPKTAQRRTYERIGSSQDELCVHLKQIFDHKLFSSLCMSVRQSVMSGDDVTYSILFCRCTAAYAPSIVASNSSYLTVKVVPK